MPSFKYKEVNINGITNSGMLTANSRSDVVRLIREKGNRPVMVEEVVKAGSSDVKDLKLLNRKPNLKDIAVFCKQTNIMLSAGMPIIRVLEILSEQTENRRLREALIDISYEVQKGIVFSKALEKYTDLFPPLLLNMVKAGEMTGQLDGVFEKMAVHYEKEFKITNKMKSAMIYPMILAILSVLAVSGVLMFIMPMFTGMFESSGVKLPLPTRMLIALSDILRSKWYIIFGIVFVIIYVLRRYFKTENGKRAYDRIVFSLPKIKYNMAIIATARFTRTMSTLLGSGIPIIEAIGSSANVTNNTLIIDNVHSAIEDIKKGETMSNVLRRIELFPSMMTSMISIGEESGSIEEMLNKTADYYDEEFEAAIARMVAMLEPAMIIIMGGAIGFIVISIMFPMFEMSSVVG